MPLSVDLPFVQGGICAFHGLASCSVDCDGVG